MAAQAFSSLADNALFIAAIALILELQGPDWMAPLMKWSFALAYVVLAAFVGAIADSFPKGRVMFATNALKVSGCLLMFLYANFGIQAEYQTYLSVSRTAWSASARPPTRPPNTALSPRCSHRKCWSRAIAGSRA